MQGKKKLLMLLLPAFLVGIIAYVFFNASTGTTAIVVAKTGINAGMKVKEDMLMTMQVPNTAVPKGALTDINDVIGKSVAVTRAPGDIIFRDILSSQEPALKDGEVFAAVQLPAALSSMVGEGSNIDIIQLTSAAQTPAGEQAVQPQIIQHLPVYSVIESESAAGQTSKYAIVKVDKDTAVKVANITAGEYAVIISK